MKFKSLKKLWTTFVFTLAIQTIYAYDFEVDGIYYEVTSASDLTCKVVSGDQEYSGDIVIPAEVSYKNRTLKVTSIGNHAFSYCRSLTSIEIPNSVTGIGSKAFSYCSSLTSIEIPNSVTKIAGSTFYNCSSLTSVEIPNSVTEIYDSAFKGCSSLTSIEIPNSVTDIGCEAFKDCTNLENIKLSDNLERINYGTFNNCKSLESIIIPGSIRWISQRYVDSWTFSNCDNLKSIRFEYSTKLLEFGYEDSSSRFFSDCVYNWTNTLETIFIDRRLNREYKNSITDVESVKEIVIGEHLEELDIELKNAEKLTTITSYATTPPEIPECTHSQYMDVKVRVPNEALEAYRQTKGWKMFWDLEGFETSGVDEIQTVTEKEEVGRYNLLGAPISEDYKGIVIVRYSDGSTKKFMNK